MASGPGEQLSSGGGSLSALVELARRPELYRGELRSALREITETAADLVDVDRVNVWLFDRDRTAIRCLDHYHRSSGEHDRGMELRADEYPSYFGALPEELVMTVEDAVSDPRTTGLAESYLEPHGIGALMDAPVRRDGEVVGVVCHEHVGRARRWTDEEMHRAGLVSDFVALALESRERREVEEKYRNLFELSRDMIFLLDAGDGRFLETNELAARRLEYEPEELVGMSFRRVHPEDTLERGEEAFRQAVEAGEVRFLSRFVTRNGDTFPVEISANRLELGGHRVVQAVARDVTDWVEAREALEASERRYRELFERNVAGVFRTTPDGEILEVNEAFARILGYDSPGEVTGSVADVSELFVDEEERERLLRRLEAKGSAQNHELRLRRKDGSTVWILENSSLVTDPEGGGEVIEGTLVDITEQKRLRQELEQLAYRDSLTEVANRRLLQLRAEKTLARARREGTRSGLVYMDLVRFKRINDTLGHAAGDRALAETADRLRAAARESDTVARVGGDEFAVLLADVDGRSGALRAAERLAEALEPPLALGEEAVDLEARVGVALFPDHADDYDTLLSAADAAMYRPDPSTPPNVHLSDQGAAQEMADELALEQEARAAVEEGQMRLHWQPVVRGDDGRMEGAEALLRWQHPERGLLVAGAFIHLAERSNFIHDLDGWALSAGLARMARWRKANAGPGWIAVNLSAASLRDPELVERVAARLEEHGVEPGRLVLEVTERSAMRSPVRVAETLREIRALGVRISLDDFGTGHAALAYLERFPADLIKMDGAFLPALDRGGPERDAADSGEGGQLAKAILRLGHAVGMRVVAEQVETAPQRAWLEDAGFDLLQGFHVGEPVPPEELVAGSSQGEH